MEGTVEATEDGIVEEEGITEAAVEGTVVEGSSGPSAFSAPQCSSSPKAGSTAFLQFLAICPNPPHLLHFRFLGPSPLPSELDLILTFLGLPGALP